MRCVCAFCEAAVLEVLKQTETFISLSRFTLLNKHKKPIDHKTENLLNDRNYGPKINKRGRIKSYKCRITVYMHLDDLLERVYRSFTNL